MKRNKNIIRGDPYRFECPWCGASKGSLCKDLNEIEYTDGSFHRARLMKDCLKLNNQV
jgi:hypothetical protein